MNFTTVAEIESAETKDLIAYYNAHNASKQIKKFADRQTAIKRCVAVMEIVASDKAAEESKTEEVEEIQNDAPASVEAAEETKAFVWPFATVAEQRHKEGDRREIAVEVDAKKPTITASAAAMLRKIGSSLENGVTPAKNVIETGKQQAAFKALVIAGFATYSGPENNEGEVSLTSIGVDTLNALPEGFGSVEIIEKRPLSHASNAAGVAASWNDPVVREARLTRNAVSVTFNGATTIHKSTTEAFRFYRLMLSKHIRFRGILKAAGQATYTEVKKDYIFNIVDFDENTKFDK